MAIAPRRALVPVALVSVLLTGAVIADTAPARATQSAAATTDPRVLIPPVPHAVETGWEIPTLGPRGRQWQEGRSTDGTLQLLVQAGAGEKGIRGAATTTFALRSIRNGRPTGRLRTVTLAGQFGYDAISNDGTRLFVTQDVSNIKPDHYQVRMVDLTRGALDDRVLTERPLDSEAAPSPSLPPELMYGSIITRLRVPTQKYWIFSLYDGAGRAPFVHALNTRGFALCVDLPKHHRNVKDIEAFWSLRYFGTNTNNRDGQIEVSNSALRKAWRFTIGTETYTEVPYAGTGT